MLNQLEKLFPGRVMVPRILSDLPENKYMVYVLVYNGNAIVVGHGRKNRASVILDDANKYTSGHIKALFVRLYHLFGTGNFERYIIECRDKTDAASTEKTLQQQIGGNHRLIPDDIRKKLFEGISPDSVARLVLEIALRSSFDGLSDLKKWRADGLLKDDVWNVVNGKLKIL